MSFRLPVVFFSLALHGAALGFLNIRFAAPPPGRAAGTAPFALVFTVAGENKGEKAAVVPPGKTTAAEPAAAGTAGAVSGDWAAAETPGAVSGDGSAAGTSGGASFFDGDELRELLRSRIEKNLVYPPLARRRNIEGKVGCVLRIGGDGRLLQNNISHSSGSAILDRAALELFAGIFPLTEIRSDRTATVTISVEYRLK